MGIPKAWPIILMGDFNARVSNSQACTTEECVTGSGGNRYKNLHPVSEDVFGRYNLPARSDNGDRILSLCENHGLCIVNTFFKKPIRKTYV